MHPSLVIPHPDKTAEDTYSIVDMHYIIPYRKRRKVIDGKLFALLDGAPDSHPMEPVENLMVTVAADLVLMVYESIMDIALRNELGHDAGILGKDRLQPVQLRLFFAIDSHPVSFLKTFPDVLCKKFEVLVERRLWSYAELYGRLILSRKRHFQIDLPERLKEREEGSLLIHIRRIQPQERLRRQNVCYLDTSLPFLIRWCQIRIDFCRHHLLFRKLSITIEYIYGIDFVTEKRDTERIII